ARPNRTRRSAVDGGERSGAVAAPVPAVLVTEGHLDGHVARLTGLPVTPAQPALPAVSSESDLRRVVTGGRKRTDPAHAGGTAAASERHERAYLVDGTRRSVRDHDLR